MRIIARRSLGQPSRKIESRRRIQGHRIAVKKIRNDGVVSICSKLISHQLGVLPYIFLLSILHSSILIDSIRGDNSGRRDIQILITSGKKENSSILVDIAFGFSNISLDVANFCGCSCWSSTGRKEG